MRRAFGLLPALLLSCAHPTEVTTTPVASPAPPPTTPAALPTATAAAAATPAQTSVPEVSGYDKPPQNVLDVLHAPAPARPMMSPPRDRILLVSWVTYPSLTPVAAYGPSIQVTDGMSGESSTFEARDTLNNKHDEDLFDFFATSQLAAVDTSTAAITPIGKPAVLSSVVAAPDGQHLLVETLKRPYSYNVTYGRFAHTVDVWDRSGKLVHTMATLPSADRVPVAGVPTGPRDFEWRATEPATLGWAEALDGGDWNVKVPARDKVMIQAAPFEGAPHELLKTEQRFSGLQWTDNKKVALLHDYDENRHWQRTYTLDVDAAKPAPAILFDLSSDEHYKDPGEPVYRQLQNGEWVIRTEGNAIFMSGEGATPDGIRPFLNRLDNATKLCVWLFF